MLSRPERAARASHADLKRLDLLYARVRLATMPASAGGPPSAPTGSHIPPLSIGRPFQNAFRRSRIGA